ncbi:tetratricopeptide repeat protein [Streptomyces fuscichromogenes]|nr:tetratricopeptide repeat protein [Streptomyces fuscichromogenes]
MAEASLPPVSNSFSGRLDELDEILRLLRPNEGGGREPAVLVSAVSGLGGIGKTALAVVAARRAVREGWFPGGVIFMDLRGYDEAPAGPDQVALALLEALGIRDLELPNSTMARYALLRTLLNKKEEPMLLLLDNVSHPEQIMPVLPESARHRVLITSRHRIPQVGARLVPLGALEDDAANSLLDRALRVATSENDTRIADDSAAAMQLIEACGSLPLALQIAVALLAMDARMSVRELAEEISLDRLEDGSRSVRATFSLSYHRLQPEQAHLFRILSIAPGVDIGMDGIASLLGGQKSVRPVLAALHRAHLVETGLRPGRWRMHDLVREYGSELISEAEREEAEGRILDYYDRCMCEAVSYVRPLPTDAIPVIFNSRAQALEWLDRERTGLVSATELSGNIVHSEKVVHMALRMWRYLVFRRYFEDYATVSSAAQQAASRVGDVDGEAKAWNNLGCAFLELGHVQKAIDAHSRARDILRAMPNGIGEASALNNLGVAFREAGQLDSSIAAHERARDQFHDQGMSIGEAGTWDNLGVSLRMKGRTVEAKAAHHRAYEICNSIYNDLGKCRARHNLGLDLVACGQMEEACAAYEEAAEIATSLEDFFYLGEILRDLACGLHAVDDVVSARAAWNRAASAFETAGAHAEASDARSLAARDA